MATQLLILPLLYGLWVILSLIKTLRYKYDDDFSSKEAKIEITILLISLTPWVGLPIITYFDQSQSVEAPAGCRLHLHPIIQYTAGYNNFRAFAMPSLRC